VIAQHARKKQNVQRFTHVPMQISKSALFAVGSPHSWPAVLAALTWLVELLNYNGKAEEGGDGGLGAAGTA
jgi:hypothetical protein